MLIGSRIGPYRILDKLGSGGMGQVFLAEHALLGRKAAVKTLLPALSAHHEIIERFFNEARATSAITDPGVVQIFDFGYHVDGTAYIVMELLEGESLAARIDRLDTIPVGDALRIVRQCAGSVAAAHARGIVHRDLKPENIFLVPDAEAPGGERPKVLDFGICKLSTTDAMTTQTGTMFGTPAYMSPEQCRGAGAIDQRADIYAFGCLLFHMLTGRPPFLKDAPGELLVAHMHEEPPRPSDFVPKIPADVDEVVLRCLAKSPDERFQSMTALQTVLARLELDVAIDAAPDFEQRLDAAIDAAPDVPIDVEGDVEIDGMPTPVPRPRTPPPLVRSRPPVREHRYATPQPTPSPRWSEPHPIPVRSHRGLRAFGLSILVLAEIAAVIAYVLSRGDHRSAAPPAEPLPSAAQPAPAPAPEPVPVPVPVEPAPAIASEPPAAAPATEPTATVLPPIERPKRAVAKKQPPAPRQRIAPAAVPIKPKPVSPPSTEELYETR